MRPVLTSGSRWRCWPVEPTRAGPGTRPRLAKVRQLISPLVIIWSYHFGAGQGRFVGSKSWIGFMCEPPTQMKSPLSVRPIKDGKAAWWQGSVVAGAEGRPAPSTGAADGSRRVGVGPGWPRDPPDMSDSWQAFDSVGQIAAGLSGGLQTGVGRHCSTLLIS